MARERTAFFAAGRRSDRQGGEGFTLIELLLALAIFALVMGMAGGAFWSVTKAWNRGESVLGQLHRGEYAMEQLVAALRGAAWFPSKPEAYGFWLEDGGGTGESAENKVSFVTAGSAFLPPDSLLRDGLHRLEVTAEGSGKNRGLTVRAWAHVTEEAEKRDKQEWQVLKGVKGFACEWYDFEDESWSQDWEETNSLPKLVRVTLTMQADGELKESLKLQRLVVLEVAPELPGRERKGARRVGEEKSGTGNRNREEGGSSSGNSGSGSGGSGKGGSGQTKISASQGSGGELVIMGGGKRSGGK